jgi:hypothetical protein
MANGFDIVLSKTLTPEQVTDALADLLPSGLRIDVKREIEELPDEPGAIWAILGPTNDPYWTCLLNVLACSDECSLGPYPDLAIATWLSRSLGVDSLCDTHDIVEGLDPHNPYWSLACISGRWYLASTSGTPLMGPYTDGIQTFVGDEKVRLLRSIEVPRQTNTQRCPDVADKS